EALLSLGFDGEPRIAFERLLHGVEAVAVDKLEDDRREHGAPKRLEHLFGIAPDFGIESGAAGVEHADDGPIARCEPKRFAEARAAKAVRDRSARDHFRGPR